MLRLSKKRGKKSRKLPPGLWMLWSPQPPEAAASQTLSLNRACNSLHNMVHFLKSTKSGFAFLFCTFTNCSLREKEQMANSALETQDEKGALPWAGGLDLRGSCKPWPTAWSQVPTSSYFLLFVSLAWHPLIVCKNTMPFLVPTDTQMNAGQGP